MKSSSHRKVTEIAIDLINNEELKKYKKQIIAGSYKEDFPRGKILGFKINISSINHFYHPEKHKATWFSTKNAKQLGIEKFNKALKLYKEGKLKKAYKKLGASLHYVHDLACPSHTNFAKHYLGEDDFEDGIDRFLAKMDFNKIKPVRKRMDFYFEDIAKESSKFHSGKKDLTEFFRWLLRKSKPLSESELEEQRKVLIPISISYTLGMLKNFIQKTQKAPVV